MNDLLEDALQDYLNGRFQQEANKYRQVMDAEPNNLRAYEGLGLSLTQLGKNDEAQTITESALEVAPSEPIFHYMLGMIYEYQQKYQSSEHELRKAIELDPQLKEAFTNLGIVLYAEKRFSEAEQVLKRAIEFPSADWQAFGTLALSYARQNRAAEAFEAADRAYQAHPSVPSRLVLVQVGHILYHWHLTILATVCVIGILLLPPILGLLCLIVYEIVFGSLILIAYLNQQHSRTIRFGLYMFGGALLYILHLLFM